MCTPVTMRRIPSSTGGSILERKNRRKMERKGRKEAKAAYYQKMHQRFKVPTQKILDDKGKKKDNSSKDEEILSADESSEEEYNAGLQSSKIEEECDDPIMALAERALHRGLFGEDGEIDRGVLAKLEAEEYQVDGREELDENDKRLLMEDSCGEGSEIYEESYEESAEESYEESAKESVKKSKEKSHEGSVEKSKENVKDSHAKQSTDSFKCKFQNAPVDVETLRKVQGLVNKLSVGNFESVVSSIVAFYQSSPRQMLTQATVNLIYGAITKQARILETYMAVYAGLAACMAQMGGGGVAFIGCLLERLLDNVTDANVLLNVVVYLGFLYNFQLISNLLLVNLIQEACSAEKIQVEANIEVILSILRICGAQMRREDPAAVRTIILQVGEAASAVAPDVQSSRFKFLLSSLLDLKNNRQKTNNNSPFIQDMETIKQRIRSMLQSRGLAKMEPIRVSLEDLRMAESRGRWWLVGGSWKGQDEKEVNDDSSNNYSNNDSNDNNDSNNKNVMANLAKQHHMNTDIRKAIFNAILISTDYLDGLQRILNLKLTARQEINIPPVLIHCVVSERIYNPYYGHLAGQLVMLRRNIMVSFRYAFWDALKAMQEGTSNARRTLHLARFYGYLVRAVGEGVLRLSSLLCRVSSFIDPVSESERIFLQLFLSQLLAADGRQDDDDDDDEIVAYFVNAVKPKKAGGPKRKRDSIFGDSEEEERESDVDAESSPQPSSDRVKEMQVLRDGLIVFFRRYLSRKALLPLVTDSIDVLVKRADMVRRALAQHQQVDDEEQ